MRWPYLWENLALLIIAAALSAASFVIGLYWHDIMRIAVCVA